ncbi:MAG: hypothetical protein FWD25_10685 [Clostridia bacterium]|nr:hypothetical protein [Clostridia bacterium]
MRRFGLLLALLAVLLIAGGCGSNGNEPEVAGPPAPAAGSGAVSLEGREIVNIRERMFATQISDIYTNPANYVGKGVRYEGFYIEEVYGAGEIFRAVIRMSPDGCCGDDGRSGFEIVWDQPYPKFNDWVEVTGVLEQYAEGGIQRLRVQAVSLRVLAVRGAETVFQ